MFSKFKNRGRKFEDVIEEICGKIAEDERIDAKISKRIPLIGEDSASHEFDVLYEYEHCGLQYRVAIECKSWNKPINKSEVTDFAYKLKSVGNINGIFISETRLQKGAELVSKFNNIKFIKYSDFRKFSLSKNERYLIPDYRTIGDPFWIFMDMNKKSILEQHLTFNKSLFLFESKYYAKEFEKQYINEENISLELVGVSQKHLKDIRALKDKYNFELCKFTPLLSDLDRNHFEFTRFGIEELDWFIRE